MDSSFVISLKVDDVMRRKQKIVENYMEYWVEGKIALLINLIIAFTQTFPKILPFIEKTLENL